MSSFNLSCVFLCSVFKICKGACKVYQYCIATLVLVSAASIMYCRGYPSFSLLPVLLFLPEAHVYPADCRGLQHWRQWSFPSYIRRKMISTATAATSATSLDTLAQLRRAGSCEQTRSQLLK